MCLITRLESLMIELVGASTDIRSRSQRILVRISRGPMSAATTILSADRDDSQSIMSDPRPGITGARGFQRDPGRVRLILIPQVD